jgi:hypothetical protein
MSKSQAWGDQTTSTDENEDHKSRTKRESPVSLLANIDFLAGDIITIFDTATLYELQFPNLDPRTSDTPDVAMARQDLSIVMRRMDRFIHNLWEPITTTPDTLIRAIDMYNQRNLQAHPADLLRLTAPEALDRLKEVDALARKSNALSTDEMSALDFTNSWYVEQQFKEVDGKFIWNHEYEALKNAAKAKQKGLLVTVAVNAAAGIGGTVGIMETMGIVRQVRRRLHRGLCKVLRIPKV